MVFVFLFVYLLVYLFIYCHSHFMSFYFFITKCKCNNLMCYFILSSGMFIFATPGFIIELSSFPAPHGLGGELFCRLMSTQYFVFVFGKVSVLKIVALALERWFSIVKPITYKLNFTKKRIYLYIGIIWLLSAITNGSKPLKAKLNESSLRCTWSNIAYPKQIFIPSYTTLTFFIPTAITWLSFFHVANVLKNSPAEQNARFRNTRRKLTRMCALVAFLLTMCWLPNQVFYTLSAFDVTRAETPLHHFTIVLAMSNSCVNPWICCFTNRDYKMAMERLLCSLCIKRQSRQRNISCSTVMSEMEQSNRAVANVISFRYLNHGLKEENENQL